MEKKIEILIDEHGEIIVNDYNIKTDEMVHVLFKIVLSYTKGNFQENFFPLGSEEKR